MVVFCIEVVAKLIALGYISVLVDCNPLYAIHITWHRPLCTFVCVSVCCLGKGVGHHRCKELWVDLGKC